MPAVGEKMQLQPENPGILTATERWNFGTGEPCSLAMLEPQGSKTLEHS